MYCGLYLKKEMGESKLGQEELLDHKIDLMKSLLDQRRAFQERVPIKGVSH